MKVMNQDRASNLISTAPGEGSPATGDGGSIQGRRAAESQFLRSVLQSTELPIEIVLWNGEQIVARAGPLIARLRIHDRATLWRLIADPSVQFGDAYASGKVEVEGDLVQFLEAVYRNAGNGALRAFGQRLTGWMRRARANSLAGSRNNVHHHYDLGNQFYTLWLGPTMSYTCAYFPTASASIDEAQVAKMHHVCRKLRLTPGESVVEAGCGWGGLALHMARHYGVKVKAFNISHEQIEYARARAKAEGLEHCVQFVEDDYRNISGRHDTFVSVGMLEHVGVEHYGELGEVVYRCLKPSGRGLLHSIGRNKPAPMNAWIEKRIFPGAYPPSLREMLQVLEPRDLSVLDVENLRLHYSKTLQHWLRAFDSVSARVADMFDQEFVRMWRLYLAGSIAAFNVGDLQLFQVVFAMRGNNDLPWTRAHLYS